MNREIKFKAWYISCMEEEKPKIIEWFPEFFSDMSPITGWGNEFPELDDESITLLQYTGFKDKNGKEIYEGDYLDGLGYVVYIIQEARFGINCLGELHEIYFSELKQDKIEIIGNIYENPELLEVE